jgi:hypothetical protein
VLVADAVWKSNPILFVAWTVWDKVNNIKDNTDDTLDTVEFNQTLLYTK